MDIEELFKHVTVTYRLPETIQRWDHPTLQLHLSVLKSFGELGAKALRAYLVAGDSPFYDWTALMKHLRSVIASEKWPDAEKAWVMLTYAIRNRVDVPPNKPALAPLRATIEQLGGLENLRRANTNELRPSFIGIYRKIIETHTKRIIMDALNSD